MANHCTMAYYWNSRAQQHAIHTIELHLAFSEALHDTLVEELHISLEKHLNPTSIRLKVQRHGVPKVHIEI